MPCLHFYQILTILSKMYGSHDSGLKITSNKEIMKAICVWNIQICIIEHKSQIFITKCCVSRSGSIARESWRLKWVFLMKIQWLQTCNYLEVPPRNNFNLYILFCDSFFVISKVTARKTQGCTASAAHFGCSEIAVLLDVIELSATCCFLAF